MLVVIDNQTDSCVPLTIERDDYDQYVLNHCTKYLATEDIQARHNYHDNYASDDPRGSISEHWRFPIVDSFSEGTCEAEDYNFNLVTFVYAAKSALDVSEVQVVGTFSALYQPIAMRQILFLDEPTRYYACSVKVPKGEVHRYKFIVDGQYMLDPINPQSVTLHNGKQWSRFFTQLCTIPISFQTWEMQILERLTSHILPFRTIEGSRFLENYYFQLDRQSKERNYAQVFRMDEQVGIPNFIDKLVAKEECHRLKDYKICLSIIDRLLRQRRVGEEPSRMSRELFVDLYYQMAQGNVPDWDYSRYENPGFFLQLLRRHTITGAFAHPKYGGNVAAAAWSFLKETYLDTNGTSLFDWCRGMEVPIGINSDYFG